MVNVGKYTKTMDPMGYNGWLMGIPNNNGVWK